MGILKLVKEAAKSRTQEPIHKVELKFDRDEIKQRIFLGVVLGILSVVGLIIGIYLIARLFGPDGKYPAPLLYAVAMMVRENPPWTVITALITAPALILLWYWRTLHTRANICNDQQRQFNERFSTAIQLLGNENEDTRLGAIYALEHLMKDAPNYQPTIIETLSAFIRRNSPFFPTDKADQESKAKSINTISKDARYDIQAALTVIGRRDVSHDYNYQRIDLSHSNLTGYNFDCGFFQNAFFARSNLEKAQFFKTNLQEAYIVEVNLHGANMLMANLELASLSGANLRAANLVEANFQSADLSSVNLKLARLSSANLQGAMLTDANLQYSILNHTNLKGTFLDGANFQEAYIENSLFNEAEYTIKTMFPDGFDPKAHGMILVDNDVNTVEQETQESDSNPASE